MKNVLKKDMIRPFLFNFDDYSEVRKFKSVIESMIGEIASCNADLAMESSNQDEPTAIDVYRGKTTLKITYVDSIATDTVVIFKEQ